MKRILFTLAMLSIAAPVLAWGEKGHAIVNEAATLSLPTDMPHFFYRSFPDLVWLGFDADRWKNGGESIDATSPDHYIDLEFVAGLALPRNRWDYVNEAIRSGRLRQKGIDHADIGFLPWRIAELSEQLTSQFRQWRFSRPGSSERTALERAIINTSGNLGHYVGDSANPHHTTIHHNGWLAANPERYATDCGTHSRFESQFVTRAVSTRDVVPKVDPPALQSDYFKSATAIIDNSNSLITTLYGIDRDGGFRPIGPIPPQGFNFATDRLARGASLLRDLWWSAWKNSERAPRRRSDD